MCLIWNRNKENAYPKLCIFCPKKAGTLELAQREEPFFPQLLVIDSPAVGDLNEESHEKLLKYFAYLASDSASCTGLTKVWTEDRTFLSVKK